MDAAITLARKLAMKNRTWPPQTSMNFNQTDRNTTSFGGGGGIQSKEKKHIKIKLNNEEL